VTVGFSRRTVLHGVSSYMCGSVDIYPVMTYLMSIF